MTETGPDFNAIRTKNAYDILDRAVAAARRLAAEQPHRLPGESDPSVGDELAYLLEAQVAEEKLDFVLGALRTQVSDDRAESTRTQVPAPSVSSEAGRDNSAEASTRPPVSAPWLQLMGPAVITAQVVAAVALVIVWTPGLLSESLAQVLNRKGRLTVHPLPGGMVVAQADIPPSSPRESEAAPSAPPVGAAEPTPVTASSESPASPAPMDIQPDELAPATNESLAAPAPANVELNGPAALPPLPDTDTIPVPPIEPLLPAEAATAKGAAASSDDGGRPEETGILSPLLPTTETALPPEPVIPRPSAATPPVNDRTPTVADGFGAQDSAAAKATEVQVELPVLPAEASFGGLTTEVPQQAATLPNKLHLDTGQEVMPAPETSLSLPFEPVPGVLLPPVANSPAPDPVERLVEMVETLATERQAALERERERANALARELALAREELGALRLRPSVSWGMAVPLPIPAPEPMQSATSEASPEETTGPAITAALTDQLPAPPAEDNRTASEPLAPPPLRLSSADEQRLLDRAEALLRVRDISGARLLLERAGERGSARGVYLLAQTYDPTMLAQWQVRGITGDPEKAQKLYAQSRMPALREANGIATPR